MSGTDATRTVTDESFTDIVLNSTGPVLVDFWAPWCGPCKALSPVLDDVAAECGDRITVAKLDVDANPEAAKNWQVMSLPTMIVFRDGAVVLRLVGAKTKSALLADLSEVLCSG